MKNTLSGSTINMMPLYVDKEVGDLDLVGPSIILGKLKEFTCGEIQSHHIYDSSIKHEVSRLLGLMAQTVEGYTLGGMKLQLINDPRYEYIVMILRFELQMLVSQWDNGAGYECEHEDINAPALTHGSPPHAFMSGDYSTLVHRFPWRYLEDNDCLGGMERYESPLYH